MRRRPSSEAINKRIDVGKPGQGRRPIAIGVDHLQKGARGSVPDANGGVLRISRDLFAIVRKSDRGATGCRLSSSGRSVWNLARSKTVRRSRDR